MKNFVLIDNKNLQNLVTKKKTFSNIKFGIHKWENCFFANKNKHWSKLSQLFYLNLTGHIMVDRA